MRTHLWGLLVLVFLSADALALEVISSYTRSDFSLGADKQVWEGFFWAEGWNSEEQFYPMHFKPAGSLHVVLRNNTDQTRRLTLLAVDGKPLDEITTTPERVGAVIWHTIEPAAIAPGEWAECKVRLREIRDGADTELLFGLSSDDQEHFTVKVPPRSHLLEWRIESMSFSPNIGRLYIYLRSRTKSPMGVVTMGELEWIKLDGQDVTAAAIRTESIEGSGLSLIEVPLEPKWDYGSVHLIEVKPRDSPNRAWSVRAWDGFFSIGLFGPQDEESVKDAREHGINTYFVGSASTTLTQFGMSDVSHHSTPDRFRSPGKPGNLFIYVMDEPDAHDWKQGEKLPLHDRLGVNAMVEVLPRIRHHRERDTITPAMLLVNNTFKPLNYYVYGQIADVYATDPYVPLGGTQLDRVPGSLRVAHDACAPYPLIAALWATSIDKHRFGKRPPTPQEERMMVFYALGCGVKGISYFADISAQTGEGLFWGVSDNEPLWKEVGAINRDIAALAPFLSISCPISDPIENEQVWIQTLQCGADDLVVIVVNKQHYIGYETQSFYAWNDPLPTTQASIGLPSHFEQCHLYELLNGEFVSMKSDKIEDMASFVVHQTDTARAFLISANSR